MTDYSTVRNFIFDDQDVLTAGTQTLEAVLRARLAYTQYLKDRGGKPDYEVPDDVQVIVAVHFSAKPRKVTFSEWCSRHRLFGDVFARFKIDVP